VRGDRSESQAADAFGVERASFWDRARGNESAAPKHATRAVAVVTGVVLLVASADLHTTAAKVGAFIVLAVPGLALERFYKARRRRRQEQLLPPGSGS
jgi:hypothetical protein